MLHRESVHVTSMHTTVLSNASFTAVGLSNENIKEISGLSSAWFYIHLAKMSLCHNLLINQKMWLVTKSIIMIITIIIVYKLLRLYVHTLQHSGSIACNIIEHIWTQGSKLLEWFFTICYKMEENSPSTVPTTRDWSRYYIGILVINTRTIIMESYSTYPQHAHCMSY